MPDVDATDATGGVQVMENGKTFNFWRFCRCDKTRETLSPCLLVSVCLCVCLAHTVYIDFYCAFPMRIENGMKIPGAIAAAISMANISISISLSPALSFSPSFSVWQLRGALHAHQIHRNKWGRTGTAGGERGRRRPLRQLLGWVLALQLRRDGGCPQVSQPQN